MRMIGRIGLGLIITAAACWGGWTLWANTRKWCPAAVPVSLAKGSHTQTSEFQINVTGAYEITVEAETNNPTDVNSLACALGNGATWPEKTCSSPSVLKMSWSLATGDKTVAQGSSEEARGGATSYNSVTRTVGYFQGQAGQHYKLVAEMLADGSSLATANPRLKVNVGGAVYNFSLVVGGLIRWGSGIVGAIGLALFLLSMLKRDSGVKGSSSEVKI
jgi:hypothetical protein